ncbi:hypothetical protein NFI96_014146, partial [Prochilodus magdalenae]
CRLMRSSPYGKSLLSRGSPRSVALARRSKSPSGSGFLYISMSRVLISMDVSSLAEETDTALLNARWTVRDDSSSAAAQCSVGHPLVHHQWTQDAAPQDAAPQDAAPQDTAQQDAAPQDAAHRTLPHRTLPHRILSHRPAAGFSKDRGNVRTCPENTADSRFRFLPLCPGSHWRIGVDEQRQPINGTPASQLSTPHSMKSPSPSPTSPGSLKKRKGSEQGGSSVSLASTKVCSLDEGEGPVSDAEPVEETTSPAVPASISDRYRVGRMIGDGNFAVVHECVERSTGRAYALKIINKGKCRGKVSRGEQDLVGPVCAMWSGSDTLRPPSVPVQSSLCTFSQEQMIQNEVAILRRVKHPNIVLLIEEMDTYSELYLVMELVKGGDLFDAITSATRYTERDASGMLYNLANAIKYLHSLNIVHRDIKPENLLVYEHQDGSKSLKLGDFGLATVVDGPLYTVCGTPTYVAPEIIAETGYGLKVDIWAAGVITYILLCGFPPFRGSTEDQEALFDQILLGQLEFPLPYWDNVSDSAKELITSMLQVEVDQRYTALQVLEHPWVTNDGLSENEHQLSVAGKIKKHFNTGPKPSGTTPGVNVITVSCDPLPDHTGYKH